MNQEHAPTGGIMAQSIRRGCDANSYFSRRHWLNGLDCLVFPYARRLALAMLALVIGSLMPAFSLADDWRQWRGNDGQGHSTAKGLPVTWSESQNIRWRCALPGRGWSSPVIHEQQIWLTTAIEKVASPEAQKERLKSNTGDQPLTLLENVQLRAICVDLDSGKILHDVLLLERNSPQWVHALNSYSSPTPVWEDDRLYCHFGAYGTACVDTRTAKVIWTNTELEVMHENGPGGSPVVVGDVVVVNMDGSDHQFIAAFDKATGQLKWKTDRSGAMKENPQLKKSYGTCLVMSINGATQIVSPATDWLYGYDPATGKELWKLSYGELGFSLTPRPVVGRGKLFMATGFGRSQILAIAIGQGEPSIVWRSKTGAPTMPSPILIGEELYYVNDAGILTCLDADSGQENYRQRLGGNFSSSPIAAEGRIYVGNREGSMFVIEAGKEYRQLAENKLSGKIFATPAIAGRAIYLRTDEALYRIEANQ